jgi:serine/threonine-protein kinase RsbT
MQTEFERVLAVLQRHISPANARSMLLRTLREQGLSPHTLSRDELRRLCPALRRGVSLFVDQRRREVALLEVSETCGSDSLRPDASSFELTRELDVGKARAEARRVCELLGATGFSLQKVATIVSELARNMIVYANGGQMEIVPVSTRPKRIIIRAIDQGPGIPNLEEIFSGKYKSKTGLGRGLFGSKRLADHFEIASDSSGTRIIAEVLV